MNRQVALSDYAAGLDRALGAARTVKLFGAEDREAKSIGVSAHAAYEAGVRIWSSTAINLALVRLGIFGAFLAIMIIDGRQVAHGGLTVGQFVSLFAFAMYAVFPVTAAMTALTNLRTSAGAYQHLGRHPAGATGRRSATTRRCPRRRRWNAGKADCPAHLVGPKRRAAGRVRPCDVRLR